MIILPFGNCVIHIPVSTWWINNRKTFSLVDIYYISAAGWELVQLKALVGRSSNGCLPSPCQDTMSWWKRKCFWGLKVKWNSHTDFSVMSVLWLWMLVAVIVNVGSMVVVFVVVFVITVSVSDVSKMMILFLQCLLSFN